ncbi:nitrite reductase large subunit NirB [Paenibacillus sp. HN-1]|uniref:nitrite reductase large subunit NirB n=1 Tax=Paenibacillus TaxID=44249 RepID=UPI001CAA28A1|nr:MULTISPECIES: nitrite reductase large subunit NirB [Paenibacillus]MBY9077023.1 nitrite reductase large subunit NirB [Paenibacillus sp. CGMCC 1.18879]MBY9086604.1 nitrite reductase large subunit NirB [Paenibacillus sinensis]
MESSRKQLVLVGNGMAGVRAIEHLLKLAPDKYNITIFGAEPHPNYNRIMLSSVLAGGADLSEIVLNDDEWYESHHITLHKGHTVTEIDTRKKVVISDGGILADYDELILATGSNPFMLPLPGADKEGVIAFRDIKDCEVMMETSRAYRNAVVIGGGLLGLEAARGLLHLGMNVSVVHIHDYIMERQLDREAALMLQRELEAQGMKFLLKKQSEAILGHKRVKSLLFADGTSADADLIVMAVGIRPNTALAEKSGLSVGRGVLVGDYLETNIPNVYAIGECAEHRGIAYGLVAPLYEQGAVLAKRLAGVETNGYAGSVTSTKLKVSGVDVFSAGRYEEPAGSRALRYQDEIDGVYKKLVIEDDKLIGAVLFGDTADGPQLFSLIKSGESIKGQEKSLLLGLPDGAGEAKASPASRLEAMADDEIICGCNGVSKGAIAQAITEGGCNSVLQIKACTKASASCGGCKPLVEGLLDLYAGDSAVQVKEGICGCTSLGRDEIVAEIKRMELKTVKEVMNVLGWDTEEGCSKCRPSLNYYLGMLWPEEYRDEKESRITNERYHANIQKDGTYSVVPRIYGGVTSPAELKKIAEVAEKFDVPLVKFTGGQRLDLLGVQKKDLPKIWEELDMPSGHAYGKTLRTVKTCVGSTFCRFGTQDSIAMGIRLEKEFERLNTPAKVKLAVSGCPRNCAEATIKDFGVVAIDGGWELHVGGNGGVHVRATDLLCVVRTEDEVVEWSRAFLQYYRENANWNERTSNWVERVGLDSIKEALADPEERKALGERIRTALSVMTDPWKQIVDDKELRKNFEPITEEQDRISGGVTA